MNRLASLAFIVLGCAVAYSPAIAQPIQSMAPTDWAADFKMAEPKDLNPDPAVLEINLVARVAEVEVKPGERVRAWTYDGGLPGPLIRAKVGDRLIVHFKNELPQSSTVHWHGVRVPIEMDGVPGISQPDVETGGSFTYDFVLRDAGLYWYHPHVMSAAQVGFGLYGALLVEDPSDGVGVADQLTLVLSDIGFDKSGELDSPESGGPAGMVFGREGAHLLVNGRKMPKLLARAGAPQRWRIVNTAKSRFFFLDLEGQQFVKIGSDGGLQEHPTTTDALLITPGERADVIVTPTGAPGSTLTVRAMLYNRGYGSVEYRIVEELFTIELSAQPAIAKWTMPSLKRDIQVPNLKEAKRLDIVLSLPPQDSNGQSEFLVDGVPFWKAKPYLAKLGATQLWVVKNDTSWDHPFHLHGFFFIPVDEKGAPIRPIERKDTINIPMKETARFLVTFDERPGTWMFHCHILDHADGGLMGTVHVGDGPPKQHTHQKPPTDHKH
jgi:FtsP/CotA-like multicopper oxidase with cupredoxin domain